VKKSLLEKSLRRCAPGARILVSEAQCRPYESDGLTACKQLPKAVVLPRNLEETQAVLAWCTARNIPIVARGAGTGLSGGALPHPEGVLLGLSRLRQIIAIDPANRVARVQTGVRNVEVSQAAAAHGLYYAPDPSSQVACTIGGNIAENSGGVHCLKYGLTVHNVLGLKWLDYSGELMCAGHGLLDGPGHDLLALMHGSEGLLGIVVEATLRLLPRPRIRRVVLAAFREIAEAAHAVSRTLACGVMPAGLEMMDELAIKAAEAHVHAGYPESAAALLLCEVDGTEAQAHEQVEAVCRIFTQNGAHDTRIATTEAECERLWQGRKAAFPALGRIAPDYYCMDGTIPKRKLAEVLLAIGDLSKRFSLQVANVFHAGDGNLHPLILYDANDPAQFAKATMLGARILELCLQAGGTITGEHGVGVEKLDQMCHQFSSVELEYMHRIKQAFDPSGQLNPGKAVPTLTRCAELSGMHVHAGELPFAELPRF